MQRDATTTTAVDPVGTTPGSADIDVLVLGHDGSFVDWADKLLGEAAVPARDLRSAVRVLRERYVDFAVVYLPDLEPRATLAIETLGLEMSGGPIIGIEVEDGRLRPSGERELVVCGMTLSLSMDTPLGDVRSLLGVLARRRDVAQRKKVLRQLIRYETWSARSVERLDEWVHELRTPLGVVRGFTANMKDGIYGDLTDSQQEAIGRIQGACELLRSLVEQVRADLPAPPTLDEDLKQQRSAGRTQLYTGEICREVIDFMSNTAESAGVRLELQEVETPKIWGDRMRLIQAVLNLVKNAIRFTPTGGEVVVSVGCEPLTEENPWPRVAICVKDTGKGIDVKHIDKVFEEGWTTDKAEGHQGMGLNVVQRVVKEHGGQLAVESPPGHGATLRLVLPADPRRRRRQAVQVIHDRGLTLELLSTLRDRTLEAVKIENEEDRRGYCERLVASSDGLVVLDPSGQLETIAPTAATAVPRTQGKEN